MVVWIVVKFGDQVFRAVLDTGATLSILARRLLKSFKKTKTVAIRVGVGRTIHSPGGVDATIRVRDEFVTQHCRVLGISAFDIVIGMLGSSKPPFLRTSRAPLGIGYNTSSLRHIRERELSRRNRLRRPASFKVDDLVLVHHSRLPSLPHNCLHHPFLGPYHIIRIDGSRIHVRCSPRLGGELLCAPKQLRHYHCPDDLCWDEWRLSDSEVERIDLVNAASSEDTDEIEEMTADVMAVDGYYVVAGIVRYEFKHGWNFRTLWDGYGLSQATWEPMSALIQPDESINPIFQSYLVENNSIPAQKEKKISWCLSIIIFF